MIRTRLFYFVCRIAVPLWLLAGAIYKLAERNPKLLPPPVLKLVQGMDGFLWLTGTTWLDTSIRLIILAEFLLVATMLCMPRLARSVAIAVLSLFCLILLIVIVPEFQAGGFAQAWKGSCGCFGASGPNPVIMLAIDLTLLILAIASKRPKRSPDLRIGFGFPSCAGLAIIALLAICTVPDRAAIDLTIESPVVIVAPNAENVAIPIVVVAEQTSVDQPPTVPLPPVEPIATPVTPSNPWPSLPTKAAPYYVPEISKWISTRLDSQEVACLMTPPPPAGINSGVWIVIFYREDCEHCHQLMQTYFSGELLRPTLAISIPDTDAASSMEMPCGECQIRSLVKGPQYILQTPVMMRVENGIVTQFMTDPDDRASIDRCLAP